MAATIDGTALRAYVIATDIPGVINNITPDQFLVLLNQAIANKWTDLKTDIPSAYGKNSSVTLSGGAFELAPPADMDSTASKSFRLYWSEDRSRSNMVPMSAWRRTTEGNIRFEQGFDNAQTFYLEYVSEPNQYVAIADTILETASIRAKQYLSYEIRKLYYDSLRLNEQSAAGQAMQTSSDRIS